jgi:hypothetical protein
MCFLVFLVFASSLNFAELEAEKNMSSGETFLTSFHLWHWKNKQGLTQQIQEKKVLKLNVARR